MTSPRRHFVLLRPLLLVGAAALVLGGCSAEVSVGSDTPSVDQAEVETKISEELEAQVGQAPDAVDCPGDLEGEVDETMRCVLTAGEDEVGVTVTVTDVEGTDVGFDIQVDDEVM
ncbi:DUF4333 domain-containing protein [Nocardioides dongxiaopingii]|uniref:DUF4333 domain-containing protein n=1 Tax=Nocardioides dongxiaopingii TaxID=2576036 RepID=UPI0010C7622A|nr:DUF4333 domain-containing protein [Nocardioides dongxiaopingii]